MVGVVAFVQLFAALLSRKPVPQGHPGLRFAGKLTRAGAVWVGCWAALTAGAAEPSGPQITSLSPTSGLVGTLVTIHGHNLFEVTGIEFNGVAAPVYGALADGTAVQTEVPRNATSGPVTVLTPYGAASSPEAFQVLEAGAPVVTDFSPASGPVGTSVTLAGSNLVDVTRVKFNGVDASFSTFLGLIALVPPHATTGPISVTTARGTFTTSSSFTVTTPGPPEIFGFSPTSGAPGTTVHITGTNLLAVDRVLFNGVAAESFVAFTNEELEASVPRGATTGPLSVESEAGTHTSTIDFMVTPLPPPVVTGFFPESARPGTLVTVTGFNFQTIESVQFAGVPAEFYPFVDTEFTARVPYAPSGPISVTTSGGSAVSERSFTVIGAPPPPRVLGFTPTNGMGGTAVTILATNLGTVHRVLFGKVPAEFRISAEGLTALVPPFAASGPITVETELGTVVTQESFTTYNSGELGVLSGVSASPVLVGTRVAFSITLTNLSSAPVDHLVMTNSFAADGASPSEIITGPDGLPMLTNAVPAEFALTNLSASRGSATFTDGTVTWEAGKLESAESVTLTAEIEASLPQVIHLLSVATGETPASKQAHGSSLTSVVMTGSMQLTVHVLDAEHIEVSWPGFDQTLVLQSATAPVRTAVWTDVEEPVTVIDGRSIVVVSTGSHCRFFRLVQGNR